MLIQDSNHHNAVKYVLRHFGGKYRTPFSLTENQTRQFVLVGASMLKIFKGTDFKELLDEWFQKVNFIESENFLKVSKELEFEEVNVEDLEFEEKCQVLLHFIRENVCLGKIMVFFGRTSDIYDARGFLEQNNLQSSVLSSKMTLNERIAELSRFQRGETQICLCTDLMSRGLDFPDLSVVIQFSYAKNAISFLHRIGRTGRMGRKGKIVSFVSSEDFDLFSAIHDKIENGEALQDVFSRNRSFNRKMRKLREVNLEEINK